MKKVVQKTCMAIVAALVFVLCICVKPDTAQAADGGWLYFNADDGNWYYYVDGVYDTSYTGLALNEYGWVQSTGVIQEWQPMTSAGGMYLMVQSTGVIQEWHVMISAGGI